jgi:hypothetical protein
VRKKIKEGDEVVKVYRVEKASPVRNPHNFTRINPSKKKTITH